MKNFLDLADFERDEIVDLLAFADRLREREEMREGGLGAVEIRGEAAFITYVRRMPGLLQHLLDRAGVGARVVQQRQRRTGEPGRCGASVRGAHATREVERHVRLIPRPGQAHERPDRRAVAEFQEVERDPVSEEVHHDRDAEARQEARRRSCG